MIRTASSRLGFLIISCIAACDPGLSVSAPPGPDISAPNPCKATEVRSTEGCVTPPQIKVDTVGYLVDRNKIATVPASDSTAFAILDADTKTSVFDGSLSTATDNSDTGDKTQLANFSDFRTSGTYVLHVDGLADSPPFAISSDVWNDALRVTMLGLYGQRCGQRVEIKHQGVTFVHEACHTHDAVYGAKFAGGGWTGGVQRDASGGWHDAGDYGKYTVNASFALAFLLKAWEDFGNKLASVKHIPDYQGDLAPWLVESKYQMDQLLKMQLDDGSALHMIGPHEFPGTVLPEFDTVDRHFTGIGTAATADLVAVAAIASRVFRASDASYADKCLAAAQAGQAYLDANTSVVTPFASGFDGFTHAAYNRTQDKGERFWALAELWRTTGDPALLSRVEDQLPASLPINFDWGNVDSLGLFTYAQADSPARNSAKLDAAHQAILGAADKLVLGTQTHAYGRGIGAMYYWGSNGVLARSAINLFVANQLSPDAKYLDAAAQQVDHLFGRNPFGRTMVTGLGYLPAYRPHHRPSQGDGIDAPWPGLLVGGTNSQDSLAPKNPPLPPGLTWFDSDQDYYVNEVAINWNTALAYALAGFYQ